jgi:hypothetical protein
MKPNRTLLAFCGLVLAGSLSGCATFNNKRDVSEPVSQSSPWLDPSVEPNEEDMTTAQKVVYCIWWPMLSIAQGFCSQQK